jgi:hypothetical protein
MNRAACWFAAALLLAPGVAAGQGEPLPPPAELPWSGEETLRVDLLTVPFFAVDAEGRPVTDLREDEVELRIGDLRLTPDTLDSYLRGAAGPHVAAPAPGDGEAAPQRPQQVVVLLDRAFLDAAGWRASQHASIALVEGLTAADRLTLIVNDPIEGLRVRFSSVAADRHGKRRFRDEVGSLLPAHRRLEANAEAALPPYVMGNTRNGKPGEQVHNAYEAAGALGRAEYRQIAYDLADNLRLLALLLARTPGEKTLLTFSGGVDSKLYFEGEVGFAGVGSGGSSESAHVDTRRAEPMIERFHKAYTALAAAGVNSVLINPQPDHSGREMLAQMSHAVGGALVENVNSGAIQRRVGEITAARWVAGAYAANLPPSAASAEVEVVVKRPGVRTYAPRRLPTRRSYQTLSPEERRFLVVSVVREGAPAARELNGNIASAATAGGRRLRFAAERPEAAGERPLDFFQVLLRQGKDDPEMALVTYEERLRLQAQVPLAAEARLETGEASYVWAVMAVEPQSGDLYLRRLQLLAPPAGSGR